MSQKYSTLEESCGEILKLPKIRFAGVIDRMGRRIAGGFGKDVVPLVADRDNRGMYIQLALEYLMRRDFDSNLGQIDYIASRREKVTMITIPIEGGIVLISAERDVDIEETITQVNSTFTLLSHIKP